MTSDRTRPAAARAVPAGQAGFSLVELLVTMIVVVVIMLAVLTVFDVASRTARTQTHVADMQQSQRVAQQTIVRAVRMAGRGGLPTTSDANLLPSGLALELLNNAPSGTTIGGEADAPVLEGTDVLTVRGIFNTPVYQLDPVTGGFFYNDGTHIGGITLTRTTSTGINQPLEAMRDAIDRVVAGSGDHPEALFVMSPLGEWAVLEMVSGSYDESGGVVTSVTIGVVGDGGTATTEYQALSSGGAVSTTLDTVVFAGILEEYQYYVREQRAVAGDASSELMPQLVRARLFPNTALAWADSVASLTEVVADNVLDLQVAIGIDSGPVDDEITEGVAGTSTTPDVDEWLFNDVGDDPLDAKWNAAASPLYYLRINTVVQTDRPEPYYTGDALATIEDKDYSLTPFDLYNAETQRRYHRRRLRTTVDLRNL